MVEKEKLNNMFTESMSIDMNIKINSLTSQCSILASMFGKLKDLIGMQKDLVQINDIAEMTEEMTNNMRNMYCQIKCLLFK